MTETAQVAYFSMEIAVDALIHTYSGGLGMLAGDTIRSAADLGVPMVAVTLAHRKGYFLQRLDEIGNQTEADDPWRPEDSLTADSPLPLLSSKAGPCAFAHGDLPCKGFPDMPCRFSYSIPIFPKIAPGIGA
jgi:glucan phosphorylase